MPTYAAPIADMLFILHDVLGLEDRETSEAVLTEAARFVTSELLPLNRSGDEEGCYLEKGAVRLPKGFKEAYKAFVAGGWNGLSQRAEHGGQGLPTPLMFAFKEMLASTNMAFGLTPLLSVGAYHALARHGSEEQKATYLPKLVEGTWSGTMCLTEAHCGTDLGLIRTRAEPQSGGSYRLQGTKIFITSGEHDMSENIIHLVLARLPDAPAGVKGISLFVCPKFLADGARNAVTCAAIEKKMGIKASPTCVMNFDGATAWLVGQPHKGLAAMFTMMNHARLSVGVQGLGIAEAATQEATSYAKSRVQLRSPKGAKFPQQSADPIIVHPDIRRLLLTNRAMVDGARALAMWVAQEFDVSQTHADAARRQDADDIVQLLTPVVKSFLSDLGSSAANDALQVHGGHGFIRDTGVEQFVRDARITQIYEGTNGIQGLDLTARKVPMHDGRLLKLFFVRINEQLARTPSEPLAAAFSHLQDASHWLTRNANNPEEGASAATEYCRMFGLVAVGYMWLRMIERDAGKAVLARVYFSKVLPGTASLLEMIKAGAAPLMVEHDDILNRG